MTHASPRVILITLDGVGVGPNPDAALYGDTTANTLLHVAEAAGGLHLPNMGNLGLGHILPLPGLNTEANIHGAFGRMRELSVGKDTTTGHWELAGVVQQEPLATFPHGFPEEIISAFTAATSLVPLGNVAASGTEILVRLGEEHCRSGRPIVYTSADSVFQIAAHEAVIPVDKLYTICQTTRNILDPYRVGRVIARPFVGEDAVRFRRTSRRHDYSLPPTGQTILDALKEKGEPVHAIGKIRDIFAGRGISSYQVSTDNNDGMQKTLEAVTKQPRGMIFTNLVDFDMLYGHRLDATGFARALEDFDRWLPSLLAILDEGDLLLIFADHGCDPTTSGTDHTREEVPLLAWRKGINSVDLGCRGSFGDVAATVAEQFGIAWNRGVSFWRELENRKKST